MSSYTICGGKPLFGEVTASGNKNSALPCIAAALLTDEPILLRNIPDIEDVQVMIAIAKALGIQVRSEGTGCLSLQTLNITGDIPENLAKTIRASILFAGPLLARTGKVTIAPPGGDVIGLRRLDTHFIAFNALGAVSCIRDDQSISIAAADRSGRLQGNAVFLDEMSVTATENALMAAVLAKGRTTITNAASEPHVQDLCRLLIKMGAGIAGVGSNLLIIEGVDKLHGAEFSIGPDFMEIGSFIGLAAATRGEVVIHGVDMHMLPIIRGGFRKIGIEWEADGNAIIVGKRQSRKIQPDISGMIPKIDDAPWPGFPPDLISIVTVAATQTTGTVLIHEKMFESRMFFIDMLIRMGARIILCDPHRAVVSGPTLLHGTLLTSPDIRAGMALVIAALSATDKSIIQNVYQIERGYENLCGKLHQIGADITRNLSDSDIPE
jgi:UDP-N-acetylglucosamine 1-carboxyvinyltransferase